MNNKKTVTHIEDVGIAEISDYMPTTEIEEKILKFENDAELDIIELKKTANVHFRWSEFELKRAKKIAQKMGLPYQTYIKMTLKQAMDKDEKKYMWF